MKRLVLVMAVMVMAGVAVAQVPEHGLYEATATQYLEIEGELVPAGRVATFRVGYDTNESVMLVWDYNEDGSLADETVEHYPIEDADDAIVWVDDDAGYIMWMQSGSAYVLINFHSGEKLVVKMVGVESWG